MEKDFRLTRGAGNDVDELVGDDSLATTIVFQLERPYHVSRVLGKR